MGENLKELYHSASTLKGVVLEYRNIDILLYLAKYNPKITKEDIVKNFGEKSLRGLKDLEKYNLVNEERDRVTLTNEGIFQVEGLLTLVV
ncbi:MAG: hypothetical protein B6U72_05105 [Candidatus Altiarchaeales archaeon ex4484_2]|nr:MAG: hypothetical protein B6U72_05105 [Candidatus Altiarchaeales archaeon ex4484_2]